ncbi:hypothetical protein D9619_009208 [Psilocybe cf. subviscida]|uniref:NACHT domain-containing protein n=1 Tax=Psilocybe cf. subviscida TaxID=2480587 RepID=A0A8H5FAN9_9AGAR|nr:hypothetical protein D9619_009208 [Psilocybe cf. subviscida]
MSIVYEGSSRHPNSGPSSTSIFKNAKNTHINNSSFTINNTQSPCDGVSDPLKMLYDRVAPNAILNAGGRADEVKCYPGTREEVIDLTERWMDGKDGVAHSMMWLSGPAGAGKSAIIQTIAERCKERGVQAANFFFFRSDPTRSNATPLVATLLYQIFEFCPAARQTVATVLSNRPLLFDASILDQFNRLLSPALKDIPQPLESPARRPIILLLDGLDECDSEHKLSQRQILHALNYLLTQSDCPFLVLVASRAEPQITMTVKDLSSPVKAIFLDEQYQPEKDIRALVIGEFARVKRSHHLAHMLSDHWPSNEDIGSIVKKSSGQFIFAATVMRYIANSLASPKLSLEMVQGIQVPIATNSLFVHLDAIYKYILSQAENREAIMDLLSMKLLVETAGNALTIYSLDYILHIYNSRYTPEFLHSCVSDLTALLQFGEGRLVFFHASLPDFLKDKNRAGEYYIDVDAYGAKILPSIWMTTPKNTDSTGLALTILTTLKTPTSDITRSFWTISPVLMNGLPRLRGRYGDAPTHMIDTILEFFSVLLTSSHRNHVKGRATQLRPLHRPTQHHGPHFPVSTLLVPGVVFIRLPLPPLAICLASAPFQRHLPPSFGPHPHRSEHTPPSPWSHSSAVPAHAAHAASPPRRDRETGSFSIASRLDPQCRPRLVFAHLDNRVSTRLTHNTPNSAKDAAHGRRRDTADP